MRLFLLPISTRRTLLYCQRLTKPNPKELNLVDKITSRVNSQWLKWEKAEKGWQKSVTRYGNKLFEKIAYEEWALKSIPPLTAKREFGKETDVEKVQVTFAPSLIKPESAQDVLRTLATERQGLHKKWMIWNVVGIPLTIPFALVPIIPNLPFFYVAFRAYSHWRALSGSQHLEFLLNKGLIEPSPSSILDAAYEMSSKSATRRKLESDPTIGKTGLEEEMMLLSPEDSKTIAASIDVPEIEVEILRAVQQVQHALKAQRELQDEKQHLDTATPRDKADKKKQ